MSWGNKGARQRAGRGWFIARHRQETGMLHKEAWLHACVRVVLGREQRVRSVKSDGLQASKEGVGFGNCKDMNN